MESVRLAVSRFAVFVLAVLCVLSLSGCRASDRQRAPSSDTGGDVHGLIYAEIVDDGSSQTAKRRIFLPEITVYLKHTSTSTLNPKVTTNVRGRYAIPHMPPGAYRICWDAEG